MAKYGKKAHDKIEEAMHEFKHGQLRSSSGQEVTSPKQAIAIGLSEARSEGGKVPAPKAAAKAGSKAGPKATSEKGTDKPAVRKRSSGSSYTPIDSSFTRPLGVMS